MIPMPNHMPNNMMTTQNNTPDTKSDMSEDSKDLLDAKSETQVLDDMHSRRLRAPVSTALWVLLFAAFSLTLAACGNKQTSEPIIDVAPSEVAATEEPATDVPPTDMPATEAPATEEPAAEASPTDTPESAAPESPLLSPDSPLPAPGSPLQKSSAFDSPLVIEGEAQAGFGGLGGRILNTDYSGVQRPYPNAPVRLAPVFVEPQTDEKLFILSGAESPGTMTDEEGYFLFDTLDPGEYVMIVGDIIGHHRIIAGPDEQAQIYLIETDEVINAGLVEVDLP